MKPTSSHHHIITLCLLLSSFIIITSCCPLTGNCDYDCEEHLLTADDKEWISWSTGDNLYYLVNDTDTVAIDTDKYSISPTIEYDGCEKEYEDCRVGLDFMGYVDFLSVASVDIDKIDGVLNVEFTIYIIDYQDPNYGFYYVNNAIIDTATINGTFYSEVYKLHYESNDSLAIKKLYFAKSIGFLLIEINNGNKIELINQ